MTRGKFIVIDGSDGSGKYTQSELLLKYLKKSKKKAIMISFPRYTETFFGKFLKDLLFGKYGDFIKTDPHLASVPYALDRFVTKDLIEKNLSKGVWVISDRYSSANQIHQGGKIKDTKKRKEFLDWLDRLEYKELKIAKPDKFIYLDVPVETSLKLLNDKNKDSAEKNIQYLKNSVDSARILIKDNPKNWIHIKCVGDKEMKSILDIHKEIVLKLKI